MSLMPQDPLVITDFVQLHKTKLLSSDGGAFDVGGMVVMWLGAKDIDY